MCGAYLRSDIFYLFWFWPSSRQHLAFEMYIRGVLFIYLFIDSFCFVLFVCLFIHFACELVWNVLANQKGISVYNPHKLLTNKTLNT